MVSIYVAKILKISVILSKSSLDTRDRAYSVMLEIMSLLFLLGIALIIERKEFSSRNFIKPLSTHEASIKVLTQINACQPVR